MKKLFATIAALLSLALASSLPTSAQVLQWNNNGVYGVSQFKINGELVASRFNYQVFSGPNTGGGFANFNNFNNGCFMSLGGIPFLPFNANATVTVTDTSTPANTETVAFTSVTTNAAPVCTLSIATSNAHTGTYVLSSGTCGIAEALNFLGQGNKGTIAVTQEFYDQGCTAATITGTVVGLIATANQQVHDWTTGLWYTLQPTTLTALAVPTTSNNLTCTSVAGLVCQSATTGGTWPNSAEFAGDIYVDSLGGMSVASVTHTLTPSASGTNVLQFNSPAASTGAACWLPWAGLTYNTVSYLLPVDQVNVKCTPCTKFTGYPACAIGATATVLGPIVTTQLIPQLGGIAAAYNMNPQSHTTFGLRPASKPTLGFQTSYGPFAACPALTAGQLCVVGTVALPTGFLQNLGIGATVRFTFDVTNTPSTGGTAQGISVKIGDITDFTTGTPITICNGAGDITASGTAAIVFHEQCDWTINALGTTGSIMAGGFGIEQVAALGTIGNPFIIPAAATTADILDQDTVYFVYLQTSGAETTTPPQMQNLKIELVQN